MKNRVRLHRARQKSRRLVTVISKHASRKRCRGCGRTNYFHLHCRPPKKCDFCPCYFSTHRKSWDQVCLDIIMGGQVWGTRMHAELRRPLFFSQAPLGPSSMAGTEESLRIPSSIGELNRLQEQYNLRISRFVEVHFSYQICRPTVFATYR